MSTLKSKAEQILQEKETNIIPENIKDGVQIFDVEGIYSGNMLPKIYYQLEEPEDKNGIWLQTNEYNINKDNVYIGNVTMNHKWNSCYSENMLPNNLFNGTAVSVGTDIYMFDSDPGKGMNYKYDTITKEFTYLSKFNAYLTERSSVVTDGTNIYMFGANEYDESVIALKYNINDDTITRLSDVPKNFSKGSAVYLDGFVYLFGGEYADDLKSAYKYDISNDTYTRIADLPIDMPSCSACVYSNFLDEPPIYNIYIYSRGSDMSVYRYVIGTNKYFQIPTDTSNGKVISVTNYKDINYILKEYDIVRWSDITSEYDSIDDLGIFNRSDTPYMLQNTVRIPCVVADKKLYILGTLCDMHHIVVYDVTYKTYDFNTNTLMIEQNAIGNRFITNVDNSNNKFVFDNVYVYDNSKPSDWTKIIDTIPTYYGTGEKWIKFKN